MNEIVFNNSEILAVTPEIVADLKERALASPRKRSRLCLHHSPEDSTQEMLIVFKHGSYMPPHRHPQGKSESYHLVEGEMTVYFFDEGGRVSRTLEMARAGAGKAFLYRLSGRVWHMPMATSEWLVYHETYSGPFVKELDVEFAPWAPGEEDRAGTAYARALRLRHSQVCGR